MNYTDFTQTGGFPLDTDVLDFNQKALAEVLKWPALQDDGTYPSLMILSGCVDDGGDIFSDGWLLYNGEVLPFRTSSAAGVNAHKLYLVETRQQAVFQNSQTYNVLEVTRWAILGGPVGGTLIANDVQVLPRLESIAGQRAAAQDSWRSLSNTFSTYGFGAFNIEVRRNFLTRMIHLRGELVVVNAQSISAPPVRYIIVAALPANISPTANLSFPAMCDYHGITKPDDPAIRAQSMHIWRQANNQPFMLQIGLVKPPVSSITGYTLRFHTSYPMD